MDGWRKRTQEKKESLRREGRKQKTYSHLLIAKNGIEELPKRLPHRFAPHLFLFFCFLQAPIHSSQSATGSRASGRLKIQSDRDSDIEEIKGELQSVSAPRSQGRGDDGTILWPWRSNWAPVVPSCPVSAATPRWIARDQKKRHSGSIHRESIPCNEVTAMAELRVRNLGSNPVVVQRTTTKAFTIIYNRSRYDASE